MPSVPSRCALCVPADADRAAVGHRAVVGNSLGVWLPENISLWDVTSTVQGGNLEPITLGAVLIAILVLIITTQLVRNLPALLELAILQHLDLTPAPVTPSPPSPSIC